MHVLSLKGSLLYVSPSSKRLLEYDPTELVGRTLSTICHPSDIVAVLRELKEAGPNTPVNIVYRVRRKNSGYVWLEATGKLHREWLNSCFSYRALELTSRLPPAVEQGKGRKCVILVGRPREVYRMSWSDLERLGGFGSTEYWSKLTVGGLYLYSTPSVEKVLGKTSEQMSELACVETPSCPWALTRSPLFSYSWNDSGSALTERRCYRDSGGAAAGGEWTCHDDPTSARLYHWHR